MFKCPFAVSSILSVMENHNAGLVYIRQNARPSRCWVDTDSVGLALNLFLRLQSTMLSRLAWRFQKFYINQFVFTYGNIRPDYVNLYQHHQKCAVMILFSIDMHSLCKYGRKNGYLPACIIMFIHLIVTLSVLNDIVIMPDEFINKKNAESLRCWVGTDSVSPASNRSSCIPSAMLSWVAWLFSCCA